MSQPRDAIRALLCPSHVNPAACVRSVCHWRIHLEVGRGLVAVRNRVLHFDGVLRGADQRGLQQRLRRGGHLREVLRPAGEGEGVHRQVCHRVDGVSRTAVLRSCTGWCSSHDQSTVLLHRLRFIHYHVLPRFSFCFTFFICNCCCSLSFLLQAERHNAGGSRLTSKVRWRTAIRGTGAHKSLLYADRRCDTESKFLAFRTVFSRVLLF